MAIVVAVVANLSSPFFSAFFSAFFGCCFATTFGHVFCATTTVEPMNVGAFFGASPSRTATAALRRRGKRLLHTLHVLHEADVLLADGRGTRVRALLRDAWVDGAHDEKVIERQLLA